MEIRLGTSSTHKIPIGYPDSEDPKSQDVATGISQEGLCSLKTLLVSVFRLPAYALSDR